MRSENAKYKRGQVKYRDVNLVLTMIGIGDRMSRGAVALLVTIAW